MRYFLVEGDARITIGRFVELLQESTGFRRFYNALLSESPYLGFFWENPPIRYSCLKQEYQFVLVKCKRLYQKKASPRKYENYFRSGQEIASFENLGKSSLLIAPYPDGNSKYYGHLAGFVRNASERKADLFWKTVGTELSDYLSERPTYLSTHGLGVPWLHVRVESRPKYYRFEDYKATAL